MTWTRRELIASTAAATAAAAARSALAAEEPPPLPPPLPAETFRERQERLRAAAKAAGFDALFLTPSTNLAWASGLSIHRSERLTALLLPADGPSVLVTPAFEVSNHRGAAAQEVQGWEEDADPWSLVAKAVAGKKSIGIEPSTAFETTTKLAAAAPAAKLENAAGVFTPLRMVKSEPEQALIRDAARRTNTAIEKTHKRLRRGMSETEVSRILEEEFANLLVSGGGLVQFGPSAALPHGGPGDRRLEKGHVVLIDAGCKVRGYSSDVTRTICFGPPTDEIRKVYAAVDKSQLAGITALKAGATGEEVDRAARAVLEEAGYGAAFTHRLGHGLGMDGHEEPYLVRGNKRALVAGNTVTVEPGVYLPERFGVRIEDDYAVRESSPPGSLSVRPSELVVIGG
ncbi:MAG TPA: Xaa-Pro peptidase family protein [Thermoanaerobaculia bacterium]